MLKSKQAVIDKWRRDKRKRVKTEDKQLFCYGCRQNWYNRNKADGCWHLKGAKLKEREIYASLHSRSPDKVVTLACFVMKYK
jgi:hypothetical protein